MTKEGQKTGMVCIYYDKIVRGGGINRFNGHLAGEKGQVEICKKVPAKVKTSASIGTYFPPRTTLGAQPTLKSVMKNKQVIQKCDLAIAKWFLDAFVPFNAANSTYFQHMVDALCSMIQDTRLQEPVMYEYLEEERVPDLESILADFMTYQVCSKGSCYGMQQQGTQFQRNQSSAGYH
ncbi:hypothetical protein JHK87_018849 [Glycine soja]|nr:hypothetical protein JHK87_018849 [Glycine soja]